jgi:hypothetical protein
VVWVWSCSCSEWDAGGCQHVQRAAKDQILPCSICFCQCLPEVRLLYRMLSVSQCITSAVLIAGSTPVPPKMCPSAAVKAASKRSAERKTGAAPSPGSTGGLWPTVLRELLWLRISERCCYTGTSPRSLLGGFGSTGPVGESIAAIDTTVVQEEQEEQPSKPSMRVLRSAWEKGGCLAAGGDERAPSLPLPVSNELVLQIWHSSSS